MVPDTILRAIEQVHTRHAGCQAGELATTIPQLAQADPDHFALAVVTGDGHRYVVGDAEVAFTIQSVSKPFTYGLALETNPAAAVAARVDLEPSGEAFNSISLDPATGRPRNPMINAGAIAVTGLVPDGAGAARFTRILDTFSRYAGRELTWDREVYASESATGFRNRAIANLLRSRDIIADPVDGIVEDYFRQCSVQVTCADLAVMGATLANGGVNPVTGVRVLGELEVSRVLSVMSTCGMYDYSGTWLTEVGLPAKSGIGGGVVGVLPGQLGIAAFSPRVDAKGNSVRGVAACRELSEVFDLHLLRSPSLRTHAIRRTYRLSESGTRRARPQADHEVLADLGRSVLVIELQGDLFAVALERLVHTVTTSPELVDTFVVDLTRADATDAATSRLLRGLAEDIAAAGRRLLVADPDGLLPPALLAGTEASVTDRLDAALLACEERLLATAGHPDPAAVRVPLEGFELIRHLTDHDRARLLPRFEERHVPAGTTIITQGEPADALYLLAGGVVRAARRDPDTGVVERIAERYPGVAFGELGLIGGWPRSASVTAATDVVCFALSRAELRGLRSTDHLLYTRIVEQLLVTAAERLRRATQETVMLRM